MQKFPHHYHVRAQGSPTGSLTTYSEGLMALDIAAPKQFDGPGDKWSPEDLLIASVASCLILTFRAIASASKFEWSELSCKTKGVLERVERKTQFTEMFIDASLSIDSNADKEKALQLLEKSEENCLITNSLTAKIHFTANISVLS